jgi:hypothetical protein
MVAAVLLIGSSVASASNINADGAAPPAPIFDSAKSEPASVISKVPAWLDDQSWSTEPSWLRNRPLEVHPTVALDAAPAEPRPEPIPLPPAAIAVGPIVITLLMLGTSMKKRRARSRRAW